MTHPAVTAAIAVINPMMPGNEFTNWDEIVPVLETLPTVRWPGTSIAEPITRYVALCVENQIESGEWSLLNAETPTTVPEIGASAIIAGCRGAAQVYKLTRERWAEQAVQIVSIGPYAGWDGDGDQCAVIYLGDSSFCGGVHYYVVPLFRRA